ncbi:S8 family peptidase [Lutimonas vermicola]|uniref:S8 family peptidase n=1 Tax=Lutimonas vermicola TaxID=414288 RepID=A0ABU9L6Y3_9FLAO
MSRRLILGLGLAIVLSACSSTKNLHSIAVPEGSATAVNIPAKKGNMTVEEIREWPHADIYKDSIPGMSLDKAYEFLADKKGTTVILGVIDSGIDNEHEDLRDNIWTNTDEIAGNGKDDDQNGYVDDIHGWNFLGGEGEATPEQLEVTRLYKMLRAKYDGKTRDDMSVSEMDGFNYYQKVKKDYEKRINEANENYELYQKTKIYFEDVDRAAKEKLGKEDYTLTDLSALDVADQNPYLMRVMGTGGTNAEVGEHINEAVKHYGNVKKMYNLDFNGRAATNDDPYDITDVPYGNGNTIGSVDDEMHGTHVTGIAMATRDNGKGLNGVAKNVKLLSVRAVPEGDEYDKDIALAIRYAVDNGAKVVNMSFGKSYSPNAEWVYDAIKYAASKDVLLVHAAGNDHKNIDKSDNFPTDAPNKVDEITDNVITIGAMTRHYDKDLVASFSNYGKLNVDLFAPGLEIYSTVPKNEYKSIQGTSMAAPEVAGVASLIRSYYPELSSSQVKHILMNSGIKVDLEVLLPGGDGALVPFSDLSRSGRVLNAYNALKMADSMVNGR